MNTVQTPDYDLTGGAHNFDAVKITGTDKVMISVVSTAGAACIVTIQHADPNGDYFADCLDSSGEAITITLDATSPNYGAVVIGDLIVNHNLRAVVKAAGTGIINQVRYS